MNPRRILMWKIKAREAANTHVVNVVETAPEPTLQEVATEAVAEVVTQTAKKVAKKRSTRKTVTTKKK